MNRKEDKISIIDSISIEKKFLPGPNKYTINYNSVDNHLGKIVYRKEAKARF